MPPFLKAGESQVLAGNQERNWQGGKEPAFLAHTRREGNGGLHMGTCFVLRVSFLYLGHERGGILLERCVVHCFFFLVCFSRIWLNCVFRVVENGAGSASEEERQRKQQEHQQAVVHLRHHSNENNHCNGKQEYDEVCNGHPFLHLVPEPPLKLLKITAVNRLGPALRDVRTLFLACRVLLGAVERAFFRVADVARQRVDYGDRIYRLRERSQRRVRRRRGGAGRRPLAEGRAGVAAALEMRELRALPLDRCTRECGRRAVLARRRQRRTGRRRHAKPVPAVPAQRRVRRRRLAGRVRVAQVRDVVCHHAAAWPAGCRAAQRQPVRLGRVEGAARGGHGVRALRHRRGRQLQRVVRGVARRGAVRHRVLRAVAENAAVPLDVRRLDGDRVVELAPVRHGGRRDVGRRRHPACARLPRTHRALRVRRVPPHRRQRCVVLVARAQRRRDRHRGASRLPRVVEAHHHLAPLHAERQRRAQRRVVEDLLPVDADQLQPRLDACLRRAAVRADGAHDIRVAHAAEPHPRDAQWVGPAGGDAAGGHRIRERLADAVPGADLPRGVRRLEGRGQRAEGLAAAVGCGAVDGDEQLVAALDVLGEVCEESACAQARHQLRVAVPRRHAEQRALLVRSFGHVGGADRDVQRLEGRGLQLPAVAGALAVALLVQHAGGQRHAGVDGGRELAGDGADGVLQDEVAHGAAAAHRHHAFLLGCLSERCAHVLRA
eukprot:Rhum_TRINITY_DN14338_c1_g2::Rhum_TRINITY_DN14338_c1_g2_i1::g.81579::m.81579